MQVSAAWHQQHSSRFLQGKPACMLLLRIHLAQRRCLPHSLLLGVASTQHCPQLRCSKVGVHSLRVRSLSGSKTKHAQQASNLQVVECCLHAVLLPEGARASNAATAVPAQLLLLLLSLSNFKAVLQQCTALTCCKDY